MTVVAMLVWGAGQWLAFAAASVALFLALLAWGYWRTGANLGFGLRMLAAGLKAVGVAVLALCLLEPLFSGTRARPGANLFALLGGNQMLTESPLIQDLMAERGQRHVLAVLKSRFRSMPPEIVHALHAVRDEEQFEKLLPFLLRNAEFIQRSCGVPHVRFPLALGNTESGMGRFHVAADIDAGTASERAYLVHQQLPGPVQHQGGLLLLR